jgi:hypothetical protein
MRIVLTQTISNTTCMIDMPDQGVGVPQPVACPTGARQAKAENPLTVFTDLLGKLQTEMASGRDSKLWTPPKEVFDKYNGTTISQQG